MDIITGGIADKQACCRGNLRELCIAALIQRSLQFPKLRLAVYVHRAYAAWNPTEFCNSSTFAYEDGYFQVYITK